MQRLVDNTERDLFVSRLHGPRCVDSAQLLNVDRVQLGLSSFMPCRLSRWGGSYTLLAVLLCTERQVAWYEGKEMEW